jgi:hypothetical protein
VTVNWSLGLTLTVVPPSQQPPKLRLMPSGSGFPEAPDPFVLGMQVQLSLSIGVLQFWRCFTSSFLTQKHQEIF